ncbi:TIM barrel protein [Candidatus Woesearchaeota archaeon]|jgi:deoxyribonuclease IV|nr:TIM barrel protein [Candidatus Woesearchaeota archaeon]
MTLFKPNKLLFGTAGIPHSTIKPTTINGIKRVRELGLDCMELEFVRRVNISLEKAPELKEVALKNNVELTCHGQYYINLHSLEKEKIEASIQRVLNAARSAWFSGGHSVTFHAAYYMKQDPKKVYEVVKEKIKQIVKTLQDESIPIWIRPETTGKGTQWGTYQEITKLSEEIEQVLPCIDFSHVHARIAGPEENSKRYNNYEEFSKILTHVESKLGRTALDNMHIHVSGINYGPKGERNHLILKESDLKYQELMKSFKDFNLKGCVICESPNIEEDALLLQKTYNELKL